MHMETLDRMGAGNTIIGMYKQNLDLPPGANQDANEGHGYVHCGSQVTRGLDLELITDDRQRVI